METKWIEIPAHRILQVEAMDLKNPEAFEILGANGGPLEPGEKPAFVIRKRDRRVFKPAEFVPSNAPMTQCAYLVEV